MKEIRAYEDQWNLFDEKEKPQAKANTGKGTVPKNPGEESKRVPWTESPDPAVIRELQKKKKNMSFDTESFENMKFFLCLYKHLNLLRRAGGHRSQPRELVKTSESPSIILVDLDQLRTHRSYKVSV